MLGSWIDLKERSLTILPDYLIENLDHLEKTEDFRVLTKEDTRRHGKKPQHINLSELS